MEVCIFKNTMGVAWNNKLKFHLNLIYFREKVHISNIFLQGIFDEGWCES
jgi:hypothetical protein